MADDDKKKAEAAEAAKAAAEKKAAEEKAVADAAAALLDDEGLEPGTPIGEPVECIVKKKFFDDRSALVQAGKTYYYQHRAGRPFPYAVLEPKNRAHAKAVKASYEEAQRRKAEAQAEKRKRRAAFGRLAAETE